MVRRRHDSYIKLALVEVARDLVAAPAAAEDDDARFARRGLRGEAQRAAQGLHAARWALRGIVVLLLLQQAKVPGTASAGIEGIAACSPPIQSPLVESLGPVMCRF